MHTHAGGAVGCIEGNKEENAGCRLNLSARKQGARSLTNPNPVAISTKAVNSRMQLDLELAKGVGTAIRLVPVR
jgi:hypothetical protein